MARFTHPQVVTANDLLSGDVIYLEQDGGWSPSLLDAAIAPDADAAQVLLARGSEQQHQIVGAYLTDVHVNDNGVPQPVHFREVFRTRGPSNYFHGKQAEA